MAGLPSRSVLVGVTAARLYLFGILYIFFLTTDLKKESTFLFLREGQSREKRLAEIQGSFCERLGPLDGQFYLDISANGYRKISSSTQGDIGNYAFFPLLPGLLAVLRAVFPESYLCVAIGISLAAGVIGTLALWRLAEKCGASPLLSVGVLLTFPSAPYQFVLYSESISLCLSALALVYIIERRPWPALPFLVLSGLSRPQGVLLLIPAFIELVLPVLEDRKRGAREALVAWLAALAPLSGFAVMAVVSHSVAGSPTAFLSVQTNWGRTYEAGGVLKALTSVFGYEGPPMDILGLFLGLGLIPLLWKRLPPSLLLYGVGAVAMPLLTGSILSLGRFVSISLPHILALAIFLERRGKAASIVLLATFLVLQSLLARGLIGWYFVG